MTFDLSLGLNSITLLIIATALLIAMKISNLTAERKGMKNAGAVKIMRSAKKKGKESSLEDKIAYSCEERGMHMSYHVI